MRHNLHSIGTLVFSFLAFVYTGLVFAGEDYRVGSATVDGGVYSVERFLTDADLAPIENVTGESVTVEGVTGEDAKAEQPFLSTEKEEESVGVNGRYALPLGMIGEVETVFLENIPLPFAARIDTGAATCSLDTVDLKNFERDGKAWVAFRIVHRESGESHEFEKKVKRHVSIRSESQKRPVVEMTIRIGDLPLQREFTLTDRSDFEYQVLVGRNLLNGLAAVDVSRTNTLSQQSAGSRAE